MTLKIDPETMDIPLDEDGNMVLIYGDETTAQCVRLTLCLLYTSPSPRDA